MTNVDTNKVILSNVTEKVVEPPEEEEFTGPEIVLKPSIKKKIEEVDDEQGLTLVVKDTKKTKKKKTDLEKVLEEDKPSEKDDKRVENKSKKKVKKKQKLKLTTDIADSDSD